MPRTKRPKKSKMSTGSTIAGSEPSVTTCMNRISTIASLASGNHCVAAPTSTPTRKNKKQIIKNFLKEVNEDIKALDQVHLDDITEFREMCDMFKLSISKKLLDTPIKACSSYMEENAMVVPVIDDYVNENIPPIKDEESSQQFKKPDLPDLPSKSTTRRTTKRSTRALKSQNTMVVPVTEDDVNEKSSEQFKMPVLPDLTSKSTTRRTTKRSTRASKCQTPQNSILSTPVNAITPKVDMNRPLSVLRRPRVGEQAVSMSGSPIMVSSVPREDMATVSVPLQNGGVATLLPSGDFRREDMPSLDNETKEQLQALFKNLGKFFEGGRRTGGGGH